MKNGGDSVPRSNKIPRLTRPWNPRSRAPGTVESKQLDWHGVTGCRRESAVACNQSSSELFGKDDVCRIIRGQIVTEPPNPGQQNEVGIPSDSQVEQVLDGLISAVGGDRAFPHQTPQYLADLKVEQVRSMQRLVMREN